MTKTKKAIVAIIIILTVLLGAFLGITNFALKLSPSAALNELKLSSEKADAIYEDEEAFSDYFLAAKQQQFSDEPYEISEKLKLTSTAEYKEKYDMQVFFIEKDKLNKSEEVIFYFHSGEFIGGITDRDWQFIDELAQKTGLPVVVPLYPSLPRYTSADAQESLIALYKDIAKKKNIEAVSFVGISAGGNLALSIAKQLRDYKLQPQSLVLVSPWLDLTMKNKEIATLEEKDNVLGSFALKKLGKLWAGKRALTNPTVSPLYGSNENLGSITIFASEKEIFYPDISLYSEALTKEGIEHTLITESRLSHAYVLDNTREGKQAREEICDIIMN